MPCAHYADYFLGANTPRGFCSLFDQSYDRAEGWRVVIIKGGPGTGKSTLMRSVARHAIEAGLFTERIHCSSDPESLDAVIIPSLRRAIYDGTAPHVLEPCCPGACERLLDLGTAWNAELLFSRSERIAELSGQCSALHRQATQMLACASAFRSRVTDPAFAAADRKKTARAAERLCERFGLSRRSSSPGTISRRLASAVTPEGVMTVSRDYISSFGRVVPVLDRGTAVSGLLLAQLRDLLVERGYSVTECPCSLDHSLPEHLLLADEDICFTTRNDAHGGSDRMGGDARAVRTDRFLPEEMTRGRHPERAADMREYQRFIRQASECMRRAKSVHDRLEECYRDAVDFEAVNAMGEQVIDWMIG